MSDEVQALHARISELTGRINQLNAEKLSAEYNARTWKRYFIWLSISVGLDMLYTWVHFGRWGAL